MGNNQDPQTAGAFVRGNALELVAYQTGSVVSRTIVKEKTGTVTVFAFDQGQGLSEHTAPFGALVHVLDGVADVTVGGETSRLGAGDLILMPANVPHALKAVEHFKMMLVMIRDAEK
jgi:quercetin dioxygenase-like cupin family protein